MYPSALDLYYTLICRELILIPCFQQLYSIPCKSRFFIQILHSQLCDAEWPVYNSFTPDVGLASLHFTSGRGLPVQTSDGFPLFFHRGKGKKLSEQVYPCMFQLFLPECMARHRNTFESVQSDFLYMCSAFLKICLKNKTIHYTKCCRNLRCSH